ncbi:MAG: hypothetical protein CM15mP49_23440 [Actinomycetota bacterium]|nr:MAG: hypothetical protein CM15mP49_23440 [Actinomycetota bacterium]
MNARDNEGYESETVYVAGPLFDEGERWWIEQIEQTITQIGFNTFLPHRDNPKRLRNCANNFENNREQSDIRSRRRKP